jgi:hypothetical protein
MPLSDWKEKTSFRSFFTGREQRCSPYYIREDEGGLALLRVSGEGLDESFTWCWELKVPYNSNIGPRSGEDPDLGVARQQADEAARQYGLL